ncbi:MAG TPA: hypothetical protein VK666_07890 [Chryseolinea sp.]|nr:hypothetical protein [Chryseolinea sp.]
MSSYDHRTVRLELSHLYSALRNSRTKIQNNKEYIEKAISLGKEPRSNYVRDLQGAIVWHENYLKFLVAVFEQVLELVKDFGLSEKREVEFDISKFQSVANKYQDFIKELESVSGGTVKND